jgi:uncharacterized protein (DUF1800 family)
MKMRALCAWGVAAIALAAQDTPAAPAPLTEDEKILHLLNRFTFGATPALVEEVRATGWKKWLESQLKGDLPEPDALLSRVRSHETLGLSMQEIADKYYKPPGKDATPREKVEARRLARVPTDEMLLWVLLRSIYSANAVRQVSGDFFRNHFSVDIGKGPVEQLAVDWEREVVLKHALGNFGDMLESSAKHPAMLFYLDNCLSRKPPTPEELRRIEEQAKRRTGSEERAEEAVDLAKQRGLNENYARELLELHTLGVDNYYTQEDVIEVARCLTGWTIGRRGEARGRFRFEPLMHAPGDKKFLGGTIEEDRKNGIAEGEQVLDVLKKHPGTAAFLSRKLCRYLVNDEPDEEMVRRVAAVFQKTRGDLPAVYRAVVEDPKYFERENFRAKYKRPLEFVVSAIRATGAEVSRVRELLQVLKRMNEPLYGCPDPTGYYDQAEAWRDPGSIAYRWAFAAELVANRLRGVKVPDSLYEGLPADRPGEWRKILAARILPVTGSGPGTSAAIDGLVEAELKRKPQATPAQLGPVIVAALLGSPEFQKQ